MISTITRFAWAVISLCVAALLVALVAGLGLLVYGLTTGALQL